MKKFLIISVIFLGFVQTVFAQDATALYEEGKKLKDEKKSNEAIFKFRDAIKLKPDYTDALYELGWCYNDTKDYASALNVLRKTMPAMNLYYRANFELGYAFDKLSMTDSALFYYNRCVTLKYDNANVYKYLGNIYYTRDDYEKAMEHYANYEKYYKSAISDYLFFYRKGYMQNARKNFSDAKEALLKSIELKPDHVNSYLELGYAYKNQKLSDEAITAYQKALARDPKSHIPYNGIGEVYRDVKKDMTLAMSWYQKALGIKTDERKACFGMGYCLNSLGRYEEAIGYLNRAINQESDYVAAYVELGYSLYMTNKNDDALTKLKKAVSLNDKNENARYYMGLVYISQKDKYNAQRMVSELRSLNSKHASTLEAKVNKL